MYTSTELPPRQIDSRYFRDVLGRYPTGVTVITAREDDGTPVGFVVGSFSSVSLDPPLVSFMVDQNSATWPRIREAGSFCANVIGEQQEALCRSFASKTGDRFADYGWTPAESGSPLLNDAIAWVDCDIDAIHEAGDHFIVIGRVLDLGISNAESPLLFFQGGYGSFSALSRPL